MRLTSNFSLDEFQKNDPIPENYIAIFADLARDVMEPIREFVQKAIHITSGYRSPEANDEAHGQPNSEHMATPDWCACDFYVLATTFDLCVSETKRVFNWLLTNTSIPYHQLILETGAAGSVVIHISINKLKPGVRSTKTGSTHNATAYTDVDHVAFVA